MWSQSDEGVEAEEELWVSEVQSKAGTKKAMIVDFEPRPGRHNDWMALNNEVIHNKQFKDYKDAGKRECLLFMDRNFTDCGYGSQRIDAFEVIQCVQ